LNAFTKYKLCLKSSRKLHFRGESDVEFRGTLSRTVQLRERHCRNEWHSHHDRCLLLRELPESGASSGNVARRPRQVHVEPYESMADLRMNMENSPMPFDGKRLIFGGFETILDI
jgi:hypothetical protein